jgi:hypothetical protein
MQQVKKTIICAGISDYELLTDPGPSYKAKVGDVAVFEILELGKHKQIQSEYRRTMAIIPGDLVMAAFGNRYATNQFEGYVPESLGGILHVLGSGGIVGTVKSMHYNLEDYGPTLCRFVGLVTDKKGNIINTKDQKKQMLTPFSGEAASRTKVIISLGSSMDSGKTTSAAFLVNGLSRAGHRVAFGKLTGTVFTKDLDFNTDLGAGMVSDFSDFGFPSTYLSTHKEILDLYESILAKLNQFNPDYTVIEIADGLYQEETKALCADPRFRETVHGFMFSAGGSLSAVQGVTILHSFGINPFVLSGLFTASPLLVKETLANLPAPIPVLNLEELTQQAASLLKEYENKMPRRKTA